MPDISVIVPVYNVSAYLEECLDSLVAQTYQNMEFICINDGSTDDSLKILERYAAEDTRIKVIDKENEGYGKTVNKGISLASAPWIGIVESDDFVKTDMFEKMYAVAKNSDADLIKCNFYKFMEEQGKDINYSHEYPDRLLGKEFCPVEEPEVYNAHNSVWAGIYRKSFLDSKGIRFHETPGASFQDISFQFKVLSSAKKMRLMADAFVYYRVDNVNSSVYNPEKIFCIADEMHCIEDYIKAQPQDRQAQLWPIYMRKKFYDYRWNYLRLPMEYQYAFLKLMSDEFKIDCSEGRFDGVRWIEGNWNEKELCDIIEQPISFFKRTSNKDKTAERVRIAGTLNQCLYFKGLMQYINESETTAIYGAGVWGKWVADKLLDAGISRSKLVFAVTHKGDEKKYQGIDIKEISDIVSDESNLFVIVAVKEETQMELLGNLHRLGVKKIVLADAEFKKFV